VFRRSPVPPRLRSLVLNGRWPDGAVLVGGAVRDVLRGVTPKDWDWAAPDPQVNRLPIERLRLPKAHRG